MLVQDRQARSVFNEKAREMLLNKFSSQSEESVFYIIGLKEGIANQLRLEHLINKDTDSYFEYVKGYIDGLLAAI